MKPKIPKRFKLGVHEWKVEFVDDLVDSDLLGKCSFYSKQIRLQNPKAIPELGMTDPALREIFYHELVHAILMHIGYSEAPVHTEEIVDGIASALQQAIETMEYK